MKKVALSAALLSALLGFDATVPFSPPAVQEVAKYHLTPSDEPAGLLEANAAVFRFIPPPQYRDLVYRLCAEQNLPVDAVCRLVWAESRWDTSAENRTGEARGRGCDRGLLQINSRNWEDWCLRYNDGKAGNPFDPICNLTVGIRAFGDIYRRQGIFHRVYLSWNAGEPSVDKAPASTLRYARAIVRG